MLMRLAGIKKVTAKGRTYYYHRKTGERIKEEPHTAAFARKVAELDGRAAGSSEAKPGSLGALIVAYRDSPEFKGLAERTRADYQDVFDYLKPLADLPLAQIDHAAVIAFRDKAFGRRKRRFANYVVQVLRLLLTWGQRRGWTERNAAMGVPLIRRPKDARQVNRPWTKAELDAVLEAAPTHIKAGIALGAYAALTEGDVVRFPWTGYDGSAIRGFRGKTGVPIWLPAHKDLRAVLDATKKRATVIVVGKRGMPYTVDGWRAVFFRLIRKLRKGEKVGDGLTFHGLRHTAATMLADAGCNEGDIAAVLAHRTTAMARHYSEGADRKRRAKKAIRALERTKH